ncbi:DUF2889 domain-containing protein [Variovorax sp. Root434]|uniref:DUF2889 domain-containing protein n=1 Tax=Variovorax sp. Root434 TaxID=1736536 RepID=UPI0006F43F8B|nr:DUF2889 domain-containing protein [Variovorax sp. Root434]KQX21358.1 hypothetical protein ASD05_17485 [Variovorax sp. Root434]
MSTDVVTREELHHRDVDMRFYRRSDGLFEVEGRLVDTKTHPFRRLLAEEDAPPGHHLHDTVVRLVLDAELLVHAADARMSASPFHICPGAAAALQALVGLSIGAGWNKRVRELLGGVASCTHIVELLGPMATTVLQGMAPLRIVSTDDPENDAQRRFRVDSCYAFAAEREVVVRLLPNLQREKPGASI